MGWVRGGITKLLFGEWGILIVLLIMVLLVIFLYSIKFIPRYSLLSMGDLNVNSFFNDKPNLLKLLVQAKLDTVSQKSSFSSTYLDSPTGFTETQIEVEFSFKIGRILQIRN